MHYRGRNKTCVLYGAGTRPALTYLRGAATVKRFVILFIFMAVFVSYSVADAIDEEREVSTENQAEKKESGKEAKPVDEKVSESKDLEEPLIEEKREPKTLKERIGDLEEEIRRLKEEAEARKVLEPTEEEKTREKEIKEILETSGRQYTLLGKGETELDYSFNYGYSASEGISLEEAGSPLPELFVNLTHVKQHTFSHSLALNYGILDNLSLNLSVPFSYKYESVQGIDGSGLGDISFSLQWQPVKAGGGKPSVVCFATFGTKTGTSPYEVNPEDEFSTGSGHNSIGAGVSISKAMDPLVPFGTVGYTKGFDEAGLSYKFEEFTLKKVEPGDAISLSMGIGYALSYNVSFNLQYQQSYTFESDLVYSSGGEFYPASGNTTNAALISIGTGWRLSDKTSLYVNVGFGLTPDTQDFSLGVRWPLEI